ncbi:capsule biosynthesis protein [Tateyamaria sp. ANG-S1]|uniref:capsule biosynthesis protein n=1 Tax=Tateyamaria sp. ANG-S1 TaxID=1577905 RepID=UPI00057E19E6|nr:capsule biosynthesis protein [Tateyamaria sp. ANG-S1]KIC51229.1 capsule biosynthesis protein [Tateyamaria sp. ANG-S1]
MTTKPKARKFRIKRTVPTPGTAASATARAQATEAPEQPAPPPQAATATPQTPEAKTGEVASSQQVQSENTIDAIRQEGLTGRQLRMARRVAQKHGLAPTSDFDAVRLLRAKGIDPFQRANMLELVVPQAGAEQHEGGAPDAFANLPATTGGAGSGRAQLPQTVEVARQQLPSTELSPAERRSQEIQNIQRDITRRRQKKMGLLLVRLAFFVILPTFLAGYYFYQIATPMYATKSEFLIIQNEGSGGAGPLGGLLPTQFATNADSIAVQGFLQSKDAMLRLDRDIGFKSHFTQDWIDPIQRLSDSPTNEEAYKTYKKNVKIGYDPTEGMIRMEVAAADPQMSAEFSNQLIDYAEQRVNNLSFQKRDDQMRDAREGFERAEEERRAAQENLVRLQIEGSTLDPEGVIASLRTQISTVETQIIEKEIELASLLNNTRPNQSRVDGARGTLDILKTQLASLNNKMTDVSQGANSLAELAARIQIAQADLASRDLMLQSALQQMEQARVEASRQVRYLTVAVEPIAPEEPTYPRAFENTILAFLVFAGIYLMISLTASILREQVTS